MNKQYRIIFRNSAGLEIDVTDSVLQISIDRSVSEGIRKFLYAKAESNRLGKIALENARRVGYQNKIDETVSILIEPVNPIPWPDPLRGDLGTPEFEAIWQTIKTWDINVPKVYGGYCGATGNHVKAILNALQEV